MAKSFRHEKKKITWKAALLVLLVIALMSAWLSLYFCGLVTHLSIFGYLLAYGFPLVPFGIIASIILVVFLVGIYRSRKDVLDKDDREFQYSEAGVYGTASFLREDELRGMARVETPRRALGTILGQLDTSGHRVIDTDLDSMLNKHIAVFGPTGSGKSYGFARNYILQAVKRRESLICTDSKGELYESMSAYCADNGYTVRLLDLVTPEKSDGWACIREVDGDDLRAQIFSQVMIENTGDGKGSVWDNAAQSLLKALLLRVTLGKDFAAAHNQSIGAAYDLIQNPGGEQYLDAIFELANADRDLQPCVGPYMSFKQASPNMRGNIITGLATRIQVLQNQIIKTVLAHDDIDLTLPGQQPCAYFCRMSDQHSAMNFISTLFFSFLFIDLVEFADAQPGRKCPVPVNFLLDEFTNIGTIADFEKKIATVRSRDLNIAIIFQGLTQLQERYPYGKWQAILGNCDTHLCLGCNEQESADYLAQRSGVATVKVRTERHGIFDSPFRLGLMHSTGDGKRNVMTPDEIMRMPKDMCLIIFRGENVFKAYKFGYDKHPEYRKLHDVRITDIPNIRDAAARAAYNAHRGAVVDEFEAWMADGGIPDALYVDDLVGDTDGDNPFRPLQCLQHIVQQATRPKARIVKVNGAPYVAPDLNNAVDVDFEEVLNVEGDDTGEIDIIEDIPDAEFIDDEERVENDSRESPQEQTMATEPEPEADAERDADGLPVDAPAQAPTQPLPGRKKEVKVEWAPSVTPPKAEESGGAGGEEEHISASDLFK